MVQCPPVTRGLIALDYQSGETRITKAVKLIAALNISGSRQGWRRGDPSHRSEYMAQVSRHPQNALQTSDLVFRNLFWFSHWKKNPQNFWVSVPVCKTLGLNAEMPMWCCHCCCKGLFTVSGALCPSVNATSSVRVSVNILYRDFWC